MTVNSPCTQQSVRYSLASASKQLYCPSETHFFQHHQNLSSLIMFKILNFQKIMTNYRIKIPCPLFARSFHFGVDRRLQRHLQHRHLRENSSNLSNNNNNNNSSNNYSNKLNINLEAQPRAFRVVVVVVPRNRVDRVYCYVRGHWHKLDVRD